MSFNPILFSPMNWPSPASLSVRALGFLHYCFTALVSVLCLVLAWSIFAVGVVAAVCVAAVFLAVAVPIVAMLAGAWVLRRLAYGITYEKVPEC